MLIIGTAQFGFNYGITNLGGKIEQNELNKIFNYCNSNNLLYFDTAQDYGESENILSLYNEKFDFNIITKAKFDGKNIEETILNSIKKFRTIYCFMLHSYNDYNSKVIDTLLTFKQEKLIKTIGISVYSVDEAINILDDLRIDIIQIPVNFIDVQWNNPIFLEKLKKRGDTIEIHARSIFLQGILLQKPYKYPINIHIDEFNDLEKNIKDICNEFKINRLELPFIYVNSLKWVNKVIIGIDNIEQLKYNHILYLNLKNKILTNDQLLYLQKYQQLINPLLINPSKWKF